MRGLTLRDPAFLGVGTGSQLDADASAYIAAVEAADGQALEAAVRTAINDFVAGCKADGIWTAIKAGCILGGARTLTGALVPLVGTAPTNSGFVSADYNRKNGLTSNGSKNLNTNRRDNDDPQNDNHIAVFKPTTTTGGGTLIGSNDAGFSNMTAIDNFSGFRCGSRSGVVPMGVSGSRFFALSRSNGSSYLAVGDAVQNTISTASVGAGTGAFYRVFNRSDLGYAFSGTICAYTIGTSINLSALRARFITLFDAFAAAIP